ncbi:response regulator [Paenibacillus beijingensis]|uniref:LuxR family transcriptional regulator n=1 Tax=Paenibacillus beijingensis TaxID=1126833 RepID=A0A0D5NNH9_9BACL|nr:response regulator transcription factor [Paenibacillus beijingensis]AJY76864.1 LuxR family transcriptional regulator [Paenibacillus beijingensis]
MRIVIAEDHPMFRNGVRSLLATTDDLKIIGEAVNGEEAVKLAGDLLPDLMLMDIRMPGMNGIEATQAIKERFPAIEVLILTMYRDDESVFTAMRVGAKGYVLKDADEEELLQAIRMVGSGRAVFGTGIAERMMHYFASYASAAMASPDSETSAEVGIGRSGLQAVPAFAELTRREADILALIASGDTNAQIAAHLHISAKTVANNVSNILNKLQVIDRHEARKLVQQFRRPD